MQIDPAMCYNAAVVSNAVFLWPVYVYKTFLVCCLQTQYVSISISHFVLWNFITVNLSR